MTLTGKVSEFSLPFHQYPAGPNPTKEPAGSAQGEPLAITRGPDGTLWFTEIGHVGSSIGRITSGKITEFPLPSANTFPSSITTGSDGNLWFTVIGMNNGPSKIGVITPQGKIREFTLSHSIPGSITRGPDGNLWFTYGLGVNGSSIERITPTGVITVFPLPASITAGDITAGSDGNLWFVESIITPKNQNSGPNPNMIGRMTPTGKISSFPLPSGSVASSIISGPDHNIWFSILEVNNGQRTLIVKIGRMTPAGSITEFALPSAKPNPSGFIFLGEGVSITNGPGGDLWFTDMTKSSIGRITTTGTIAEFTLPPPQSIPGIITSKSDGTLCFTESKLIPNQTVTYEIGKLTLT